MITTLERILERRKKEGRRELTTTEVSEILTTGFYDEEKYEDMRTGNTATVKNPQRAGNGEQ